MSCAELDKPDLIEMSLLAKVGPRQLGASDCQGSEAFLQDLHVVAGCVLKDEDILKSDMGSWGLAKYCRVVVMVLSCYLQVLQTHVVPNHVGLEGCIVSLPGNSCWKASGLQDSPTSNMGHREVSEVKTGSLQPFASHREGYTASPCPFHSERLAPLLPSRKRAHSVVGGAKRSLAKATAPIFPFHHIPKPELSKKPQD